MNVELTKRYMWVSAVHDGSLYMMGEWEVQHDNRKLYSFAYVGSCNNHNLSTTHVHLSSNNCSKPSPTKMYEAADKLNIHNNKQSKPKAFYNSGFAQ